jgi:iron complex transport system ATP-binding protein
MSDADQAAVDSALQQTELLSLRKKSLQTLSGGERQRAAIAMVLAQETHFILLDEPTAYLDFKHQLQLLELLQTLRNNGTGLMVVLHDLSLTARLADLVVLLARPDSTQPGRIVVSGPVEEALNEETLRQVYGVDITIIRDERSRIASFIPARRID